MCLESQGKSSRSSAGGRTGEPTGVRQGQALGLGQAVPASLDPASFPAQQGAHLQALPCPEPSGKGSERATRPALHPVPVEGSCLPHFPLPKVRLNSVKVPGWPAAGTLPLYPQAPSWEVAGFPGRT